MLPHATAQPIHGIGVQVWRLTKPRGISLTFFTAVVFHAIMPALVCFVAIASEILSNQPGPPLWP